jgi:polysaccharide pyruvyl transferase WcaK-like protein
MGASPRKIGLFGLFGSGNIGNDGSLEAMLDFLRTARPKAELVCICSDAARVQREFRIPAIRIGGQPATHPALRLLERFLPTRKLLQWLHAFRGVRGLDVLIMPGTGILDDFSERFWGSPASLFGWCLAARLRGARIAFVSVGAGPISHGVSRWLMKAAARMAHYRSYRDTLSRDFMQSIGFDASRDPVYPDIAFRLTAPASVKTANAGPEPLTVGVGVMAYFGWRGDARRGAAIYQTYLRKITRFTLWLLDRGHRVRILTGEETDQQAVDDLLAALAAERADFPRERVVAEPVHSLHDLMRQIGETQVVVATRFHNVVCALKLARPTVSLSYARKNDVLMAEMGLGGYCQHVERFDVDLLMKQFAELAANRAKLESAMREMNGLYLDRLALQERVLLEKIL